VESIDGNHDYHSRRDDDRGRRRSHDSDDDRERSWSPSQRGPRAFGRSIRDEKFPSRFRALTNVPRYDEDTNLSVWLEDYRLACHAGGVTDDLFVINNFPLYLGDSARTWLEHLPRDKIQDWTDLRRVFVGNFQAPLRVSVWQAALASSGAAQLQVAAGGESSQVHSALLQALHRAPRRNR
jgi:hypothetical protein